MSISKIIDNVQNGNLYKQNTITANDVIVQKVQNKNTQLNKAITCDIECMKKIRKILENGNSAEVKKKTTGELVVYEVRKNKR